MKRYLQYKNSGVPWLGEIPDHWDAKKIKFVSHLRSEKSNGSPTGARYVGMEHVLSKVGRFVAEDNTGQEDAESTVNVFEKNDILFGKLRPYLAKCVVADTSGFCSTEFLVLTSEESCFPKYMQLVMLLPDFINIVDASTFGSKMPRADWDFISQQTLPIPPLPEQKAIAAYLDAETARIDTLISEKEGLITLLKEWRQSVIVEAVTKGLDRSVPMKASGVPWLGDIPNHWESSPLRYLVKVKTGGTPTAEAFVDDERDGDIPWYAPADLQTDYLTASSRIVSAEYSDEVDVFDVGTIVLVGIGDVGRVSQMSKSGTGNQQLNFLTPLGDIQPDFLVYALVAGRSYVYSRANVNLIPILNQEGTKRLAVPVPPQDEQKAIIEHLKIETARIDALIVHTTEEIELLKELRSATIADAVLGRVKVF